MQHFFMSLDTLVILHYNKYHDYGEIWATTHRLSERGTVMKKRRFDWLRKTSSADVMNPKNYEYRLKQLDGDKPAEQKEAYTWFQKHAEEGDASAQYQTAMCFLHGVGVEKDEEQFLHWLTKSAEQEYGEALTTMGIHYFYDFDAVEETDQGIPWMERAIEQHDDNAAAILGVYLVETPKEDCHEEERRHRGFLLLRSSALEGNLEDHLRIQAFFELGHCYYYGIGTETNIEEAYTWYARAAESGSEGAQYLAASLILDKRCSETDTAKAIAWLRQAAEQGCMYSTMRLGECYLEGNVVPKDAEEAFQWFQKSAELGNPAAVNMVGRC